jgi:hypothetical protein
MNNRQRQIVAEKIGSTVRVLELLGLEYTVHNPRRPNPKGNKSPRVVTVRYGNDREMRVYNGMDGSTWAHHKDGEPVAGVQSIEDLYAYLKDAQTPPPHATS